jgi:K+-transporting ATPase c subunit
MSRSSKKHQTLLGAFAGLGTLVALVLGLGVLTGASTAASAAVPQNSSPPTISGTPQEGQKLTGDKGAWSGTPTSYNYFWTRCNNNGGSCSNISGATTVNYTLGSVDLGNTVRFKVEARNADGNSFASSVPTAVVTAAKAAPPPANTAPPTVSGTPQEGQTLTGTKGEWSGKPTDYNYFWTRCDKNGASCSNISGATNATYTLTTTDIANTIRFKVRAKSASGVGFASSAPTAVVTPATKPPPPPPPAGSAIAISKVSLPNRLIVDGYSFSPSPLRSRQAVTARFHVSDSNGHSVSGAIVFLERVPVDSYSRPPERATGPDGWVSFSIYPNSGLQLSHQGQIVFFLRARKAGENVLGGVSARRLVGIPLG